MVRKRKQEVEKDNGDRWLLTYSDLITLLMIFFVVMWSISKIDATKFQAIAASLSKALGGGTPAKMEISNTPSGLALINQQAIQNGKTQKQGDHSITTPDSTQAQGQSGNSDQLSIMDIKAKLDKFAAANGLQNKISSTIEERGLVVSIQDTILFNSGSADITPFSRAVLNKIAVVLAPVPNYIRVEGHTDTVPINTARFPSNWELSVLRATNVVQILTQEGHIAADRLSAEGYGEYRPVASNNTETGRARNRRVDLVILRSKYDVTEPGSRR